MKRLRHALLLLALLPAALFGAPRQVRLEGTLTNTSIGDVPAPARLELTIDGDQVRGRLTTEKPLTGSGEVAGRFAGGWLELAGELGEGVSVRLRGALSPADYRGTYTAGLPGQLVQYGRFELAIARSDGAAPARR
ncbi:MAG TPA: hypothetical protein VEB66_07535 [Opitutaceae bacterium]|nr:hypothetical protein [Opitutaceae bacterium]